MYLIHKMGTPPFTLLKYSHNFPSISRLIIYVNYIQLNAKKKKGKPLLLEVTLKLPYSF